MATDTDRLQDWLAQHDMSLYALAQELDLLYNSVWYMAIKHKRISDRFVIHFIRRYGCEEAQAIFQDCLASLPPLDERAGCV